MKSPNAASDLVEIWNKHATGIRSKAFLTPLIPVISQYLLNNHPTGNLLDLGCGSGNKSSLFNKMGYTVTGIDKDNQLIAQAEYDCPNATFLQYEIENTLPFEDETFDLVFSSNVFNHFDHTTILNECKRVLKKGGSLILVENLNNNPITKTNLGYHKVTRNKYPEKTSNHFTFKELQFIKNDFDNSLLKTFHLFSPLSYWKIFKGQYNTLYKLDKRLLKIDFLKNYAWTVLFLGKKK